MKTQTTVSAQKTSEMEKDFGGKSMMPPQFKLTAAGADPRADVRENGIQEENVDSENANISIGKISNFGTLINQVKAAIQSNDTKGVMLALESLKRDQQEIAHFKAYFLSKTKQTLMEALTAGFGQEQAEVFDQNLTADLSQHDPVAIAQGFQKYIEAGDEASVMSYLMLFDSPENAVALYATANPGKDLKTELLAIAPKGGKLQAMIQSIWGERQNYERVNVKTEAEATQARTIIARIFDVYGVDVNSQKMLDIAKNYYSNAPVELKMLLKIEAWQLSDLKALETALSHFGPITGANRANSNRSEGSQSVTTVGRINHDLEQTPEDKSKYQVSGAGGHSFPQMMQWGFLTDLPVNPVICSGTTLEKPIPARQSEM